MDKWYIIANSFYRYNHSDVTNDYAIMKLVQ